MPEPMHVAAAMFTPASLIAAAARTSAPGVFSISMTRSNAIYRTSHETTSAATALNTARYRALRSRRTESRSKPNDFELAPDHADVLLAEGLAPVTRNRDDEAGFMAEARWLVALPASSVKP